MLNAVYDDATGKTLMPYPFYCRVVYCDPVFQVAQLMIYYRSLDITLGYWVDLETFREAGKSPLIFQDNSQVDMAYMCEGQDQMFYNAMFYKPVEDEDGHWWPELSMHCQFILDTLYGTKGDYRAANGEQYRVMTNIDQAKSWFIHALRMAEKKLKAVLSSERYQQWSDDQVFMEATVTNQEVTTVDYDDEVDELADRL